MIAPNKVTEFLEASLRCLLENPDKPHSIVIAYTIPGKGVTMSYKDCGYTELQQIGQELINEGTMWLIANSRDKIEQYTAEAELQDSDEA